MPRRKCLPIQSYVGSIKMAAKREMMERRDCSRMVGNP